MTAALEGSEGSASRPGRSLPPGKTPYPLYRRLCGPQGRSGQVQKISPPPGFDPRTVQPVASRYTDWTTRPTTDIYSKDILSRLENPIPLFGCGTNSPKISWGTLTLRKLCAKDIVKFWKFRGEKNLIKVWKRWFRFLVPGFGKVITRLTRYTKRGTLNYRAVARMHGKYFVPLLM